VTAGRALLAANMDQAVQERSRGDDQSVAGLAVAVTHPKTNDLAISNENRCRLANQPAYVYVIIQNIIYVL
jgi:hypothetical protein